MTNQQRILNVLIDEIEHGPLHDQLAAHWARVFEHPGDAPVESVEGDLYANRLHSWQVKVGRAGGLHPDAAYDIHQILKADARFVKAVSAGTGFDFTPDTITAAKDLARKQEQV